MKLKKGLFLLSFLLMAWLLIAGIALAAPGWNGPNTIVTGGWFKWPSVSNDGTGVVFLSPYPSATDYDKQIQLSEFNGTAWGAPVLLASNGQDDSDKNFAWLPEYTHPIISGNGLTVAYLGTTMINQTTPKSEVYIIDKTVKGWGTPYPLPTNQSRHDYRVDLSYDGNTIAYTYASANIFGDTPFLFVSTRTNGVWSSPVQISEDRGGAFQPSLSADGTKLAWVQNNSLVYSEYNGIMWSTPQWLVNWKTTSTGEVDVKNIKISPDGNTITYWLLTVTNSVMTAQDVYVLNRTATGWSDPVKVSPTSVVPTSVYDSNPAVNFDGSKVVYQFNVRNGDATNGVIVGSYLLLTEFKNGNWTAPTPLTNPVTTGFDTAPVMTPDGKTLIYMASGEVRSMTSSTGSTGSFVLTVTKSGTGNGTVTDAGLSCTNNTCTGTYPADSFVILTAVPSQGSAFTGWSQACSGKSNTCVVTMNAAKNVTAVFNLPGPQPNTISFTGAVKDISGNAIANALVEQAGNPLVYTVTDVSGNFVLYGLPKGSLFHVKTSKEGFIPVYSSNFNSTEDIDGKIPFKLFTYMRMYENWGVQQGKSVINGVVADNANPRTGLGNAVLTATGTGGKTYTVTYENAATNLFGGNATSANGHYYVLNVDGGDTVKVTASLTGWAFPEQTFVIYTEAMSEGSFFGTSTGPVYTISGSVKDFSNTKGIPGVLVTVKDVSGAAIAATATTDASGNYTATITSKGEYTIFTSKSGYEDASPPDQPSVSEITDTSPNIVLNMWLMLSPASISLSTGWNFISFPKDPSPNNAISEVLKEVSSNVRVVWGYNNQSKVWLKYSLKTQNPSLNTLDIVESGKGYWIYMNAPGSITMTNWAEPSTTITLYPGWNFTGYNGTSGTALATALAGISSTYVIIWNWSNLNNGEWFAHRADGQTMPASNLTTLDQKKAYWIKPNLTTGQTTNWQQ